MTPIILAIDPGATGAVATRYADGGITVENLPKFGALRMLLLTLQRQGELRVIVENVGGYMPGNSGPAAVSFARHCGTIDGLLIAFNMTPIAVLPRVWMKWLGVPPGMEQADRKRWIAANVRERFPHMKIAQRNADAMGILAWAMREEMP